MLGQSSASPAEFAQAHNPRHHSAAELKKRVMGTEVLTHRRVMGTEVLTHRRVMGTEVLTHDVELPRGTNRASLLSRRITGKGGGYVPGRVSQHSEDCPSTGT